MALLPDLVGRIRLDMSELNRAQGEAQTRGAAIGSALGTAVGSLAGGLLASAGEKVLTFVSGSVDAFAQLEDALSVTGVKFGDNAKQVEDFASSASSSFGLSKRAALEAANTFGTFGKAAELTGKPLAEFSTQMTGLAGDMASFSGTTPEEAVTALGAAFRGEYDPIEKYGVLINKEMVNQKALQMGLANTKDEITKGDEVMATRQLILEQTGQAQGDFARTSDSVANSQKKMTADTENAQAALGEKLAPAYLAVLNALNQVVGGITTFIDWIGKAVTWVGQYKELLIGLAAALLILNARTIAFNLAMAAQLAWMSLVNVINAIKTAWWALNAAMAANPIGLVIAAVALLAAGLIYAYNHSETFRNFVNGLWETLKAFVADIPARWEAFKTAVVNAFTAARTTIEGWIAYVQQLPTMISTALGDFAGFLWSKIVGAWEYVKTGVINTATGIVTDATTWVTNVITAVAGFGQMLWDKIVVAGWERVKEGWNAAVTFLTETIPTWISNLVNGLINFGASLWAKIGEGWEFIKTGWAQANAFLVQSITTWITSIVNGLVDFGTRALGSILQGWENVKTGWQQANAFLVQKAAEFVTNTINALVNFAKQLWDKIVGAWQALPAGIRQPIEAVVGAALQMGKDIINSLINVPSEMLRVGGEIIDGLLNGLKAKGQQVVDYLTNLIPGPVRDALGIASPSTVLSEIGEQTMAGLDQGLQKWMPTIRSTLDTVLQIINDVKRSLGIASPSSYMDDMGSSIGQGLHGGIEAWIPKIQEVLTRITQMAQEAAKQAQAAAASLKAEDNSMVNPHFYDEVSLGGKTYKKGDPGYDAARARVTNTPLPSAAPKTAKMVRAEDGSLVPASFYNSSGNAPKTAKMVRAEDGSLVPASFYDAKPAGNTLGRLANLPGHSLYPADLFEKVKNAAYTLGEMVMAEDGSLVPASFYANVKPAPKAGKLVKAEDGSLVPASFYDQMALPTGANLAKFIKAGLPASLSKLVSYSAKGIGVDVGSAPKGLADALYQLGFRGDPTDRAERMYSSDSLESMARKAGINIDARSFGTQLNPKDVVDQILWKAKAGGLVPA